MSTAKCVFTQEQLEDLWGAADDDVLELVAKRNHLTMFTDAGIEEDDIEGEADFDEPEQNDTKAWILFKTWIGTWR